MRSRIIFRYVGIILLLNAAFLFISAIISLADGDSSFFPLLFSGLIAVMFGLFPLVFVPPTEEIQVKEGLIIVVASWIISCLVGMLPYIIWGGEFSLSNAFFESVSGYTTTGASILNEIESLPKGLLFWRASTHWMGGVGIIIFVLSVLPSMGIATTRLYRAEMSRQAFRQFNMRAKEAIRILLYVYLGITVVETIALLLCGLSLFDAVAHTFATVATGGFSTKNLSVAAFHSLPVEIVIMVFMILSGMNFALIFSVIIGEIANIKQSDVLKYYLFSNLLAIALVTLDTLFNNTYPTWTDALRYSSFQILSVGTSTGFANANSAVWPAFSSLVLIFFTLQCACAGSTSGGIKVDRVLIMFKAVTRKIKQTLYPNAVFHIYVDGSKLEESKIENTMIYIAMYILIVFFSSMLLTLMNVDALTAFSGAAACMGNVGPGLGKVGSMSNYSGIPDLGKWILSLDMLLGRLEIYGLIIFFLPKTWEKK